MDHFPTHNQHHNFYSYQLQLAIISTLNLKRGGAHIFSTHDPSSLFFTFPTQNSGNEHEDLFWESHNDELRLHNHVSY